MKTNGYLRFPRGLHKRVSELPFRAQSVFWYLYSEAEPQSKKYTINKKAYKIEKGQVFTSYQAILDGVTHGCKLQKDKRDVTIKKIEKDIFSIKNAGLIDTKRASRNVIVTIRFYKQYQELINSDVNLGGDSEEESSYKNSNLQEKNEKFGGDSTDLGGDSDVYFGGDRADGSAYKNSDLQEKNEKFGGDKNKSSGGPLIDKTTTSVRHSSLYNTNNYSFSMSETENNENFNDNFNGNEENMMPKHDHKYETDEFDEIVMQYERDNREREEYSFDPDADNDED